MSNPKVQTPSVTYQEGASPVQAFSSPVVAVAPGDAAKRRGRPLCGAAEVELEAGNGTGAAQARSPRQTREMTKVLTLDDWRSRVRLRGHPDTAAQAGKSWGFGAWPDYETTVELFGEEDGASCWFFRGRRYYCPSWAEGGPAATDIRDPHLSRWNEIIVAQPEGYWRDFLAGPGTWVLSRLLRARAAVFWSNWELTWERLDCGTHRGWGMIAPDATAPLFRRRPDGDALDPITLPTDDSRFADAVAACFLFASVGMRDCFLADASASEVYLATHEDYLMISFARAKSRRALLQDLWSSATVYVDGTGEAGLPEAQ